MSEPFLGEIKLVSFNFPPKGWAFCNGQLLPINQNQALFSLLGTIYGGNGQTTFALPDFRGRVPTHWGNELTIGESGGQDAHTLIQSELPAHTHAMRASTLPAQLGDPSGMYWAATGDNGYSTAPNTTMHPSVVSSVGGSQPHENRQPSLVLNFIICLQGIFPSHT